MFGATFNGSISLNYTRLNLISNEPKLLGNYSQIMQSSNQTLINSFLQFYKTFQKTSGFEDLVIQAITAIVDVVVSKEFYFYYNDLYWYLPLKSPYIKISYEKIPLPGTSQIGEN